MLIIYQGNVNLETKEMNVLVTGNKGYIGTVMVPMLQTNGFEVTGLDSDLFEDCVFGDASVSGAISNITYLRKDIRDVQLSDLKGVNAVAHLCALSNDPLGNLNPKITYEINHEASVRLAKLFPLPVAYMVLLQRILSMNCLRLNPLHLMPSPRYLLNGTFQN